MIVSFINVNCCYAQSNTPLFKLLPSQQTGIGFKNVLTESDSFNILTQANIYNGAGVGIGDFNNDGLQDVYMAGNMVSNKLYLNKGSLKFTDVTNIAGVDGKGRWCTGVAIVDINADGLMDIYVSASLNKTNVILRTNLLYINQGLNSAGIPTFKEMAKAYGLNDSGFSTQAYFFDYDKDGDLDMYQVTNELYDPKTPIQFRKKVTDGSALNTDRLYRNNGNNTFTNVSKQAGITIEGWGHAACITDINLDGWPDIYVANDFVSNDLCYINNKNGTFTERLSEYFKHTGWNAMGTDAVDINNDGFVDFISLEMMPETNMRKKRMLSGNEYYNYTNSEKYGYTHQYVRNVLQLNSGTIPGGHPLFSEIGFLAGVYQTDWSWCPLVADFDNDGLRDMIITNGLPRDVTDLDYVEYNNGQGGSGNKFTLAMTDSLPVVKLANYAFKNTNGLLFENTTDSWGFNKLSFSTGAACADLDNDGDLDVVMNNLNDEAFVYENTLAVSPLKSNQSFSISFKGSAKNINGLGATANIYLSNGNNIYYEHQPYRGYLSTTDPRAHIGIGPTAKIDSVLIKWPDGKSQLLVDVPAGKTLMASHKNAQFINKKPIANTSWFANVTAKYGVKYKAKEKEFVDYNIQPAMPHKLSQYGPGIAVGDVDKNGYEDFYIGSGSKYPGVFFMQNAMGQFTLDSSRFLQKESRLYEDMGVLLFDADNDQDLDLYLVSGSYEYPPNNPVLNDRLFINDGKGKFMQAPNTLPKDSTNGSCVRAADIDGDGDLDLFVGGRVKSGDYPLAPRSFILINEQGKFTDATDRLCPHIKNIGMVTDALWTDFDNDGKVDLVLTGEWMAITFFRNTGLKLELVNSGVENYTGWWNSLTGADFDNDGDIDYVAGNLGLNTSYKASPAEPLTILAKDIDNNGLIDAMVYCYMKAEDGSMKPFPMTTKDDMISQVIGIRKKFSTYKDYGLATMNDMWSAKDKEGALMLQANHMATSYIENKGNGKFSLTPLPLQAQFAPVYGMVATDVNGDNNVDLLMSGNDFGMEAGSGRHDAFMGLCMLGDGKGHFAPQTVKESGFLVKGDGKGLAQVFTAKNESIVIATQNQDSLLLFTNAIANKAATRWIEVNADDFAAEVLYKDGTKKRLEFYYGSTYLSQSTRKIPITINIDKLYIINFKGVKRQVL